MIYILSKLIEKYKILLCFIDIILKFIQGGYYMRYCQYCGTRLEDGKKCTCPESQEQEKKTANFQGALKEIVPYLKSYFNNPRVATEEKNDDKFFELSVCLGGGFIVSVVILMLFLSGQLIGFINKSIGIYNEELAVSYPFWAALLTGIIIGAVILALSCGTLIICDMLSEKEVNYKRSYMTVALNLPLPIAFLLIGSILSLFNIKACVFIASLASISWIVLGITEIQRILGPLNESTKNIIITISIILVINLVVSFITYKLAMWTMGTIEINGERLSEHINYFFENIFQNIY